MSGRAAIIHRIRKPLVLCGTEVLRLAKRPVLTPHMFAAGNFEMGAGDEVRRRARKIRSTLGNIPDIAKSPHGIVTKTRLGLGGIRL